MYFETAPALGLCHFGTNGSIVRITITLNDHTDKNRGPNRSYAHVGAFTSRGCKLTEYSTIQQFVRVKSRLDHEQHKSERVLSEINQ